MFEAEMKILKIFAGGLIFIVVVFVAFSTGYSLGGFDQHRRRLSIDTRGHLQILDAIRNGDSASAIHNCRLFLYSNVKVFDAIQVSLWKPLHRDDQRLAASIAKAREETKDMDKDIAEKTTDGN